MFDISLPYYIFKNLLEIIASALVSFLTVIFSPILGLPPRWININDLIPTFDVLTHLSSVFNVLLPMSTIGVLLRWTIIFYAFRIIVAFIKVCYNSKFLVLILNKIFGFFSGLFNSLISFFDI